MSKRDSAQQMHNIYQSCYKTTHNVYLYNRSRVEDICYLRLIVSLAQEVLKHPTVVKIVLQVQWQYLHAIIMEVPIFFINKKKCMLL